MVCRNLYATTLGCVLALVGCSSETPVVEAPSGNTPSVDASAAKKPDTKSLNSAVAEIVELRDKIRDGFAAGDVDAAHGPLHEVGSRLEELSEWAADSDLTTEDRKTVQDCVNTLFDAFGEVDKTLHGQEGSTYEEEAAKIDEAINTLIRSCEDR